MSLDYYDYKAKTWLSPKKLLQYFEKLLNKYGEKIYTDREFRKAHEARTAAINLLGMQKRDPKNYYIQVPKEKNESPDIVTMFQEEVEHKPVQLRLIEVEVVDYEEHETRDIATFLMEEKLVPSMSKKAYDSKTTILCFIKKSSSFDFQSVYNTLSKIKPAPHVFLLIKHDTDKYQTYQVWPTFGDISYSISEEMLESTESGLLRLYLGADQKIKFKKEDVPDPTVEEVFEIDLTKVSS